MPRVFLPTSNDSSYVICLSIHIHSSVNVKLEIRRTYMTPRIVTVLTLIRPRFRSVSFGVDP